MTTREKEPLPSSPSSLQTLSAEMREHVTYLETRTWRTGHYDDFGAGEAHRAECEAFRITEWADILDASAALQEEAIRQLRDKLASLNRAHAGKHESLLNEMKKVIQLEADREKMQHELLTVLKWAMRHLRSHVSFGGDGDAYARLDGAELVGFVPKWNKAEATIAKAEATIAKAR